MSTAENPLSSQWPALGTSIDAIDTPALCIDLDVMEANTHVMADTCRKHGIDWRPHSKCHKSSAIARKLIEAGAIGVTCAKLGEAEVMADGGVRDILIANLVVGPQKMRRLVEVRRKADPLVCVDHVDHLGPLSEAMTAAGLELRVLIEVDIGLARVGAAPGKATLELAQRIVDLPGLKLAGIMGYEGHLLRVEDLKEKAESIRQALDLVGDSKRLLEENGIPCPIVSCGGTGSYVFTVQHPDVTELQAGGAVFMDRFYRESCQVENLGFAMTVLATVVGRPAPDRAIIDAGRKTMNIELCKPWFVGREGIEVQSLSAEHGTLTLAPEAQDLRIGDRLQMIPGYSDLTAVLHNAFFGFRGGRLEVVWPLEARGRLQ